MSQGKKYTYEEVKEIINNFGYELISEKYINVEQNIILKDNYGYYYLSNFEVLLRGCKPNKFHKSNPYTIQNIKIWLKSNKNNLSLVSDTYINNKNKLTLIDQDGYLYSIGLDVLTSRKSPCKFEKRNKFTIYNIENWCKLNRKSYKLLSNKYNGQNKKLQWQCLKEDCKEKFKMNLNHILQNRECPFCRGLQVGISNCLATKNPELTKEWHLILNILTPYDVTWGSSKYVWWKCSNQECGHEWKAQICSRNGNNRGCPECNKSKGEKECKRVFVSKNFIEISQEEYNKILKSDEFNNTYFISQKTFNNLIGLRGKLLSYDFYIPKYNLLIEYQGEQHEKYIPWFHKTKKDFERQVEYDKRKKNYALSNKYNFLEIWYWEFDNIEEILTDYFNNLDNFNNKSEVI